MTETSKDVGLCFFTLLVRTFDQDVFLTLGDTGDVKDYNAAVTALNEYFIPKASETHARHAFKHTVPKPNETMQQYVVRLKTAIHDCR